MNHFLKSLLFLALFTSTALAQVNPDSASVSDYYGPDFVQDVQSNELKDKNLMDKLFIIVSKGHKAVGYENAKRLMFGKLDLQQLPTGEYAVKDVYCEHVFTDNDFGSKSLGPLMAPDSGNVINTEHTWPQSKFSSKFLKETQKSDLHHLYPTDSSMNGRRGNYEFGDVESPKLILKCPIVKLGQGAKGSGLVFEAPMHHRGNVARALFYFATRYQLKISTAQEAAIRRWNLEDPVDKAERDRNDAIQVEQGNRNPFIDMPSLVDHISNFQLIK